MNGYQPLASKSSPKPPPKNPNGKNKMTDREQRIRELMKQAGHEHSLSLYQAFKQFEQEICMELAQPNQEPLTDEHILVLWQQTKIPDAHRIERFARAMEAAHGIKEA